MLAFTCMTNAHIRKGNWNTMVSFALAREVAIPLTTDARREALEWALWRAALANNAATAKGSFKWLHRTTPIVVFIQDDAVVIQRAA